MRIRFAFKKFLLAPILLAVFTLIFGAGFFLGEENARQELTGGMQGEWTDQNPQPIDFALFWDVWNLLEKKYADKQKVDREAMFYGAISGMVESVMDPYTVFMNPDDTKKFMQDIDGTFDGIGAEISMKKGIITVIAPLKNTPAERAGLKAGDKIAKIDEKITSDMTLDEAIDLIRGEKGTRVVLTIVRDNLTKSQEISIIRDTIIVPSLKLTFIGNKTDNKTVARIELYQFSEKSVSDFKKSAQEILNSRTAGIILDLRNNPGGYLESSVEIASLFMPKDKIVAIEEYSDGKRKEYRAKGNPILMDLPLVVLINQGSASASEILAGALRDNQNIKIVGEKSFGKGSIQELENLKSDTSLKITVAKWLTPSGKSIQDNGIEPDIKIEITEDDYNNGNDPQLDKAIEILKNQL